MLLRPLMTLSATLSAPRSPPPVASTEEVFAWLTDRGGLHRLDVGADPNGVRGLVTTEDADIGTVLLQVPLSATLADRGDGEHTLPGEPPEWCGSLPWNVQLAVCVLQHRADAASPWGAFLRSWPAEPPMLPKNLEPSELAEAQDPRFEADADGDYFWAEEQYFALCEAAEAAGRDGPPCTSAELRWALEMVWSRCLRLGCGGGYGVRRLLVPVLDLANHQAQPSALFTYSPLGGGAVRLHATRPLRAGDPVTITYGEHSAEHFCQYYGFVPSDDPYAAWRLRTATLLRAARLGAPQLLPPAPPGEGGGDDDALRDLPDEIELGALASLAPPLAAVRAVMAPRAAAAGAATPADEDEGRETAEVLHAALEALLNAHPTSAEQDEELLRDGGGVPPAARTLVQMRLARKRLLRALQARLRAAPREVEPPPPPSMYPVLDPLSVTELEAWVERTF
eukprot:Transcript_7119.p1 GENE.Transcript_7119~~Transcript_7119.p1  ORF type:complete len:480 (-),score=178.92 Transcript_7119:85-1443(-)